MNAFVAIFLSVGIIALINNKIHASALKIVKKTANKYDDLIEEALYIFIRTVKYIVSFYIWLQIAIIPTWFEYIIDKIFKVSFIISGLFVAHGLIKSVFNELKKSKKSDQMSQQVFPMISNVLIVFMWIIWGLTILGNLGYNITALITGAGIGGLALALAAQKSVSNIFGAISIIINKPFKVGDFVRINNYTGTIKQIGLTYLEIKDLGGNKILIPNENLISSAVENLTERENRRTDFSIGVVYETTLVKLKKWVQIIESILETYKTKEAIEWYRVHFDNFWDFSLNINATYFSLVNNDYTAYLKQKEEINLEIKKQFEKAGINIAFPTQELIIRK